MDANERTLSRKRDVFYDPQGHAIQLCVAHELDPKQMSTQSTCVFLGFSLCDDCLYLARDYLGTCAPICTFNDSVGQLTLAIMNGELL